MSIINLHGQKVISKTNVINDEIRVDVSQLKTGLYFVKLGTDSATFLKKIILE